MALGVCFSVFDEEKGPVVVSCAGITSKLANKIAVKVNMGTWYFEDFRKDPKTDFTISIVPLLEEQMLAFNTSFLIYDSQLRGGACMASLSLVGTMANQFQFYQAAPDIAAQAKRIIPEIKNLYQHDPPLIDQIKAYLISYKEFNEKLTQIEDAKLIMAVIPSETKPLPEFNFFFNLLGKFASNVITSAIAGEKIAIIADEIEGPMIFSTLERFTPHRKLEKVDWTNSKNESADLICIPKRLTESYTKKGYRILDVKNPDEFQGPANKFVNKLVKDMKSCEDEKSKAYFIDTRINSFITRVTTIFDLYNCEDVSENTFKVLREDINKDLLDLIITYIRNTINPHFSLPPEKSFWRQLDKF